LKTTVAEETTALGTAATEETLANRDLREKITAVRKIVTAGPLATQATTETSFGRQQQQGHQNLGKINSKQTTRSKTNKSSRTHNSIREKWNIRERRHQEGIDNFYSSKSISNSGINSNNRARCFRSIKVATATGTLATKEMLAASGTPTTAERK
jgi:predicted transposase YbfD/YdcC